MEFDPPHDGDGADRALLARLAHRHRNQIQTMQGLVGLFARDLPEGRCRDAFADLKARFEAVAQASDAIPPDDELIEADFGAFAERIVRLMDPARLHRIAIDASPLRISARRAATTRHLLTEMTIVLFRRGLPSTASAEGAIAIETAGDGAAIMRVSARGVPPENPSVQSRDLGWKIAEGLADQLGATLSIASEQPLVVEVRIPATRVGR